jgi:hypothetical protein
MIAQVLTNLLHAQPGESQVRLAHDAAPLLVRAAHTPDQLVTALLQAPQRETALLVLGQCLDNARMAQENFQTGGASFLATISDRLSAARRRGELGSELLLAIAALYGRAGVDTPPALMVAFSRSGPSAVSEQPKGWQESDGLADPGAELDAAIDHMAKGGDASALQIHSMLTELLAVLPLPVRSMIVHRVASRSGPPFERLACYWLLDPAAETRRAAAQALSDRAKRGALPPGLGNDLRKLVAWLPEVREQMGLAAIIPGQGPGAPSSAAKGAQKPWRIEDAMVSMPDGAGCQNLTLTAVRGRERAVTVCLLKRGHGVKDAFVLPCESKAEQRGIVNEIGAELPMLPVPASFALAALGRAVSGGMNAGALPAPGLLDVVDLVGAPPVLPTDTKAILSSLQPATQALLAKKTAIKQLTGAESDILWTEELFESWFEQTEALDRQLAEAKTDAAATAVVWAELENRRSWWARQLALSAAVADATPVMTPFARACMAAAATSLLDKSPLTSLSVMNAVVDATLQAFAGRATEQHDQGFETSKSGDAPSSLQLLSTLSTAGLPMAYLYGWGAALAAAPVAPSPTQAIRGLYNRLVGLPVPSVDALLAVIDDMLEEAADTGADADALLQQLRQYTATESANWCEGFAAMVASAKRSWPAKHLGPEGQKLLKCIVAGSKTGLTPDDTKIVVDFVPLLVARAG